MTNFPEIQKIMDRIFVDAPPANHGRFWRGKTLDDFLSLEIYGIRAAVPGEPERSGLLMALRGKPPFAPAEPAAHPKIAPQDIEMITNWIAFGCPNDTIETSAALTTTDRVTATDEDHVLYWRGVDFFFLPGLSSAETARHVNRLHFRAYLAWHAHYLEGRPASVWEDYIAEPDVQESFRYIRLHQRRLIEESYGTSKVDLFDSLWKFGGDLLPPDPQIAIPSKRTMNSPYDWFFWAPYIEMSLRDSDATDADLSLAQAWQIGVVADGLLRNRLIIGEFDVADPDIEAEVKDNYADTKGADLIAAMQTRAVAFQDAPDFDGWPTA